MSEQTDYDNCGNFDYTADECMLPWNHYDPPQINDLDLKAQQEREDSYIKNLTKEIAK